jgi:hypothetical protein
MPTPALTSSCTIAEPATRATIQSEIANATDFCELLAQALADDVFRTPLTVTIGKLWSYTGAAVSCRLRYSQTPYRITVHNSAATCRWLLQTAAGWHPNAAKSANTTSQESGTHG